MILPNIVRWRRDLVKTSGRTPYPIVRGRLWLLGYPDAARADVEHRASRMHARSAKLPR